MFAPNRRFVSTSAGLLVALLAGSAHSGAPVPSLDAAELAQGPYSSMHMLLQKTVLHINVANIDVRVDKATQAKLASIANGQKYSYGLDFKVAQAVMEAPRAVVQMKFVRDIPFNRWVDVVKENLEQAREAGLITKEIEQRVGANLPLWFAAIKDRGYEKGDRLIYAPAREGLRTVVVALTGQVLIDRFDAGAEPGHVVLASYFTPKSDFREPLIRSLFESR
jgi:hypothetical protein